MLKERAFIGARNKVSLKCVNYEVGMEYQKAEFDKTKFIL